MCDVRLAICTLVFILLSGTAEAGSCPVKPYSSDFLKLLLRSHNAIEGTVKEGLDGKQPSHYVRINISEGFGYPGSVIDLRIIDLDRLRMIGHRGLNSGDRALFFVRSDNTVHPCHVLVPHPAITHAIQHLQRTPNE
jgi:hypothetical protein